MPWFNELSGKNLQLSAMFGPDILLLTLGVLLLAGLAAGSYPAFYLTSFQPVSVLKGRIKAGMKSGLLRNVLVVFQFAVSICLLICTAVVFICRNHGHADGARPQLFAGLSL